MSDRTPRLEGGACAGLAPGIAEKYFDINTQTQVWERQTAKAICGNCAIRALCLDAALVKPDAELHGVIAGQTAADIRLLKQWRDYDQGSREEIPRRPRPVVAELHHSDADKTGVDYHHTAQLTFEERVQGVFLDLRAGKYNKNGGISRAIGAIAFIRDQMASQESAVKRATI